MSRPKKLSMPAEAQLYPPEFRYFSGRWQRVQELRRAHRNGQGYLPNLLRMLSSERDDYLRALAASHPKTDVSTKMRMTYDHIYTVRMAAQESLSANSRKAKRIFNDRYGMLLRL